MPLIFLSGVFSPVNNVPTWLEVISKINPLTYGVDAIRQLFLGGVNGAGWLHHWCYRPRTHDDHSSGYADCVNLWYRDVVNRGMVLQ